MIKIYFNKGQNKLLNKTIEWIETELLTYELIPRRQLSSQHLKHILSMTDNGFEDILLSEYHAKKIYSYLDFDYESFSTNELIEFILHHQDILGAPIIFDENHLCVGYDTELFGEIFQKIKYKERTKLVIDLKKET